MRDAILRLIIALEDKASSGLRGIQGALQGAGSAALSTGQAMLSLAAPVGAAAAGGIGLGIAMNASAEQTEAAFTTLLGSGERAMGFLDELRAFSASTPFEFPELAESSKKLLAFGFAAEDIIPMMTNIGDAVGALGGGQAEIDRVTMALGQMQAKGKVSAEEMMQLAEMGIPAWQMLADSMGLTVAEVMDLSAKGQIAADGAIPALLAGMDATFGGAMQGQATTFTGLLSTLKDNASMALMAFTGPTFDRAKVGLGELGTLASTPAFQELAASLGEQLGGAIDRVVAGVQQLPAIWASVSSGAQAVGDAVGGTLRTALDWLSGTGLPALQPALDWLSGTGLPGAQGALQGLSDAVGGGVRTGLDWLVSTGLPKVQELLAPLGEALRPLVDGFAAGGLGGALAALPGALTDGMAAISELRTELAALALEGLGSLLTQAADLPLLTRGLEALGLSSEQIETVRDVLRGVGGVLSDLGGDVRAVGAWFQDKLLPPVMDAAKGFGEMLLPHLQFVGAFVNDRLMPILRDIGGFLADNLPGAIAVVSPLLTGLVDMGLSLVELALSAIARTWETVLKPVFEVWGGWLEDLTGGWDNLARGAGVVQEKMQALAQLIRDIASGHIDWSGLFGGLSSIFPGVSIPGFAGGVANFAGGLAIVGEQGPELVRLPGGSDVIPAGATAALLGGGGGGGPIVVNVQVAGSVTAERDLVELIRERLIEIGRANIPSGVT